MLRTPSSKVLVSALCLALSACSVTSPVPADASPIVVIPQQINTATPTLEPTLFPSLTPALTLELVALVPTPTPLPPSETPTPTETLGPYQHTIRQNETLGYIIQLYGYRDFSVIPEIVALNPNIPNADTLPSAGSVILIPRQTTTPTPQATEPSGAVSAFFNVAPTSRAGLNADIEIVPYTVLEGDTIVGIAANWATTLEVLARLNPDIGFFGCNFEIPSGGPNCNPSLRIGQIVNVPAPTPTPTLSPTPSGSETPTPTATYASPVMISPPQDAVVPPGVLFLEWVGVGALLPDEMYLVQIEDITVGKTFAAVTRSTSYALPDTLIPSDGQIHTIQWTVTIARRNEQGRYAVISGQPVIRRFQWQSR